MMETLLTIQTKRLAKLLREELKIKREKKNKKKKRRELGEKLKS
jgi:hypothetical protein